MKEDYSMALLSMCNPCTTSRQNPWNKNTHTHTQILKEIGATRRFGLRGSLLPRLLYSAISWCLCTRSIWITVLPLSFVCISRKKSANMAKIRSNKIMISNGTVNPECGTSCFTSIVEQRACESWCCLKALRDRPSRAVISLTTSPLCLLTCLLCSYCSGWNNC